MNEQDLFHQAQRLYPPSTDEGAETYTRTARSEASLAWLDPAEWENGDSFDSQSNDLASPPPYETFTNEAAEGEEEFHPWAAADALPEAPPQGSTSDTSHVALDESNRLEAPAVGPSGYRLAPPPEEYTRKSRRRRRKTTHVQLATEKQYGGNSSRKHRRRHGRGRDGPPLTSRPWFMLTSLLLCIGAAIYAGIWIYQRDANRSRTLKAGAGAAATNASVINELPTQQKQQEAVALLDEALAARSAGEIDRAHELFKKIRTEYPWIRGLPLEVAIMLLPNRRGADALDFANACIQSGQDLASSHVAVGLVAQQDGKLDTAVMAFETAHYIDPCSADILFYWSEALREMGRSAEALKKLETAVARSASESSLYLFGLKHRLAKLEVDGLKMDPAQIQEILDSTNLPAEDYLAAAALTLEAKEIPATAELLARAGQRLPPAFFRFLLTDPVFSTAFNHPEIVTAVAEIIRQAPPPAPGRSP